MDDVLDDVRSLTPPIPSPPANFLRTSDLDRILTFFSYGTVFTYLLTFIQALYVFYNSVVTIVLFSSFKFLFLFLHSFLFHFFIVTVLFSVCRVSFNEYVCSVIVLGALLTCLDADDDDVFVAVDGVARWLGRHSLAGGLYLIYA